MYQTIQICANVVDDYTKRYKCSSKPNIYTPFV